MSSAAAGDSLLPGAGYGEAVDAVDAAFLVAPDPARPGTLVAEGELDVVIEDRDFGRQMQEMFLADLENATEIRLTEKRRVRSGRHHREGPKTSSASTARFAPSAIAIGNAIGSTISTGKKRFLGMTEARINLMGGAILLALGLIAFKFPRAVAIPLGVIAVWVAISLFISGYKLYRQAKNAEKKS